MSIADFHHSHKNLKFSRIPVYKDKSNNISGFILKDDVLEEMIKQNGQSKLETLKREIFVTTSEVPIPDLFDIFIRKRTHISIVTDEFGNVVGLVTMEDIIETLLGLEIMDESDSIEDMQKLARKSWERRAKRLGLIQRREEAQPEELQNEDNVSEDSSGDRKNKG